MEDFKIIKLLDNNLLNNLKDKVPDQLLFAKYRFNVMTVVKHITYGKATRASIMKSSIIKIVK